MNNTIDLNINSLVILPKPLNWKSYFLIRNVTLLAVSFHISLCKWLNFTRNQNSGVYLYVNLLVTAFLSLFEPDPEVPHSTPEYFVCLSSTTRDLSIILRKSLRDICWPAFIRRPLTAAGENAICLCQGRFSRASSAILLRALPAHPSLLSTGQISSNISPVLIQSLTIQTFMPFLWRGNVFSATTASIVLQVAEIPSTSFTYHKWIYLQWPPSLPLL